ncbi:MAG: peptidoglycan-binding protein [Candidatus Pacebacteria bacterium]|nr:peptidoglycan-binding protein [Candidatus Paceibacterota bacterium]
MNTKKYIGIFAAVVFAVTFTSANAATKCTVETLNDQTICDEAGLMELLSSLNSGSTPTTTPTTTEAPVVTTTPTASFGTIPAGFQFTMNLKLGTRNNEVKYLQEFLNSSSDTTVAVSGAGSTGNETTYFGPATQTAVKKFQTKYGITPVAGYWGAISRAKANELLSQGTTVVVPPVTTPTDCSNGAAFDPATGKACTTTSTVEGCAPGAAYSSTTGKPCSGNVTPTDTVVPTTGNLSVALAANNPAASTLITGQSVADLAHFTLANGSTSEVKVTAIELQRLGVSADATLANVYLFDGSTRITDAGTISSGKVTFNSTNGVIVIPANTSKTIAVKADIAAGSNGQTVGIALSGVTSSLQLSGTLPINGNIHSIANANLATVVFGAPLPAASNIDPMDNVILFQSTVAIGNRNVIFDKIALKQINSVDAKDLANFRLYVDGTEVATVASLDSNGYITFAGLNKTLSTGNKVVKVVANVIGGSGRIAQFSVRNKADVEFKDSEYGAYVAATGVPATAGALTVNAGQFSITKSADSVSGKVANNGSNVSLAKYEFKAYGEPIKVESLTTGFAFTDAGGLLVNAGASIRNGKIYVNGGQVGSTATIATAGTQFTTNFVVTPGTTTIVEVYGDVYDNDGTAGFENNDTLTFSLLTGANNGSKQVSYGTLNVPTGNIAANQVTISEGALTVTKASTYASQNAVVPQNDYKIGSWNIAGSATEDVNINTLGVNIAAVVGATFDATDVKDAYLKITKEGTTTTLSIKSTVAATGNNWPVSITLEKNKNMTVELFGRLEAGATATHSLQGTLNVTASGVSSGATITPAGVAGQTIAAATGGFNVTRAASSPVAAVVDDSGTVVSASYKFEAQSDSYTIEEILVNMTASGITAVSNVTLKSGDTVIKTMPAALAITFSGLNIVVPANESKTIDIVFDMVSIGTGAGDSGADLSANIQNASGVSYRSGSTGVSNTKNTVAVPAGNAIYAYKAFPSIAASALSTETLTAGQKTISKFVITPNGGNVSWNRMLFNVTKTAAVTIGNGGAAADNAQVKLYNTATGNEVAGVFTNGAAGSDCSAATDANCTLVFVPDTEEAVGSATTYEVRATVAGTIAVNNYVTTEIRSSGAGYAAPAAYAAVVGNFAWSDVSSQAHGLGTLDWNNENLLKTFPISQTLTAK